MHRLKRNKQSIINVIIICLILTSLLIMSIGYATIIGEELNIEMSISATPKAIVMITDVELDESQGIINEETLFTGTVLNANIALSDTDSSSYAKYTVTIYNNTDTDRVYSGVSYSNEFYTNEDIIFEIDGLEPNQTLSAKTSVTFTVTFKYGVTTIENSNLNAVLNFEFNERTYTTIKDMIIAKEEAKGEIYEYPNGYHFNDEPTEAEAGLKSIRDPDTNELLYFYRGNVTDNYVYFANNMWRILRVDTDGSLRLILDGSIGTSAYQNRNTPTQNTIDSAIDLLSWDDSIVYSNLSNWYDDNIQSEFGNYIMPSKFIFDTSHTLVESSSGAGIDGVYYFDGYERVADSYDSLNDVPTLWKDDYTIVRDIGLITGDEIMMAGGHWKRANTSYFLYNPNLSGNSWTMAPAFWDRDAHNKAALLVLNQENGSIHDWPSSNTLTNYLNMRPVITIRGDLKMTGDGTYENPYKYDIEDEEEGGGDVVIGDLQIGDYVNYIPESTQTHDYISTTAQTGYGTDQVFTLSDYQDMKWRILDINNEGEVTLIADTILSPSGAGRSDYYLSGYTGYYNGGQEMDNICQALFANSIYADEIRSINAEDINNITEFRPGIDVAHAGNYGEQRDYVLGTRFVKYLEDGQTEPTIVNTGETITLTNTYYEYYGRDYISSNSTKLELLFDKTYTEYYWVNTQYTNLEADSAYWGLLGVDYETISGWPLFESSDLRTITQYYGIRPIIKLKAGVQFTANVTDPNMDWDISIGRIRRY